MTYYINRKIQESLYDNVFFSKSKPDQQFKLSDPQDFSSYFVYKIQGDWMLLGNKPGIDDPQNGSECILGWVHRENLISWNGYLAFELNWEDAETRKIKNQPVKIFKEISEAQQFGNNADYFSKIKENNVFVEAVFNSTRPMGWEGRFMILNDLQENENIFQLTFINDDGQIVQGYTCHHPNWSDEPLFQYVAFVSHSNLYSFKYMLENLTPTNEFYMGPDQFRENLQYTWEYILVDQLKYFLERIDQINELTLCDLSVILTGLDDKEEYRDITFREIVDPRIFPDDKLYEYLIDWVISKGHIQSIYEGRNMLTKDFFTDHIVGYAIDYLIAKTGDVDRILNDENLENDIINAFTERFVSFNQVYMRGNIPRFRNPISEAKDAAETYYWIDTRIFPTQNSRVSEIILEVSKKMIK